MGWKNMKLKRSWINPLSLFRKNQTQTLWKWLLNYPKTLFTHLHNINRNKNKLINFNTHHHRRLVAIPGWPSPLAGLREETIKMQVNEALASKRLSFEQEESCSILATAGFPFKECEVVAMETEDPYKELVSSMEEMIKVCGVKRHGKIDWDCLENLLAWYLRVNAHNTHDFIVSAFVDVCFSLISLDNDDDDDDDSKHNDPS